MWYGTLSGYLSLCIVCFVQQQQQQQGPYTLKQMQKFFVNGHINDPTYLFNLQEHCDGPFHPLSSWFPDDLDLAFVKPEFANRSSGEEEPFSKQESPKRSSSIQ